MKTATPKKTRLPAGSARNRGTHLVIAPAARPAGRAASAKARSKASVLKTGALQDAILNSANFSSIATDEKGVIQIFNVGAERMLGYRAADVLNKITPADISDPQEIIARATALSAELGTPITPGFEALVFKASRGIEDIYELTYIRKDGSRFPAVVSVTALRDANLKILGYLLIGTDNTARHHLDDLRKQAEEVSAKFAAIVESSDDAIIGKTLDGRITSWNSGAEKLFGYPASAMVGQSISRLIPAELQHEGVEILSRVRGGDNVHHLDTVRVRQDGSRVDVSITTSAIKDASGKIIGASKIARDITERKQAERALQQSEAEFRALAEAMPQIVWTTRADGWNTFFSQRWMDYTGLTLEESLGHGWSKPFHPADQPRAAHAWREAIAEKGNYSIECRLRRADGIYRWWWILAAPSRTSDGTILKWFGSCTDIHERKRAEEALLESNVELERAKSAAEKASLAKSDFLSSMSHELRSPLNAILGFAQLMELSSPALPAAQQARVAQILQAGWHLLKLISEILDLSVIESGQISLSREAVSLAAVMTECQSMMEPEAQQRGIRLTFPRFDRPVFVGADMTRLKQILINLLSNAIKYNRENGTVVVDCTASGPKRIRLSVRDTGAGLPPDKVAQLFQPFNRLGQEAGGVTGTGIGLVVTKRLAELMGGVIGVESTPGLGSVFWCELSSAAAPQLNLEGARIEGALRLPGSADAPMRTVLYVEDNPANMELVAQLIARCAGLQLMTAVNGTLGIALARGTRPTVILMDVNLPGISGVEALKVLRADPVTAHIPVVALSANAMPRDIAKGLAAGFFRYVTKPIEVASFLATLNAALEFAEKTVDGDARDTRPTP